MQFFEIITVYIAIIICSSQAQDESSSLSNQSKGTVGEYYWGKKPINTPTTESLVKIDSKESPNEMQGRVENSNNPESNKAIISPKKKFSDQKNCDLSYSSSPPRNATSEMHDIIINKSGCPQDQMPLTVSNNTANNHSKSFTCTKDKTCRVLTRDTDAFYDNELIQKTIDNNGELPRRLQVEFINREPVLIYKEPHKALIKKREIKKSSDYDYNYYDEKNPDESNALKGGFLGTKKNMSKILKPLEKHNKTRTTKSSVQKTEASTIARDNLNSMSTESFLTSLLTSNESTTAFILEHGATINQIDDNGPEEIDKISDSNDVNMLEENRKIKSVPKKKDPFKFRTDKPANCLPQGGVPKNPGIPPIGRSRDPEYDKLIKGEIPEKVVKTIIDKVKKNPTMSSELGICEFDVKEIKDLFNSIRNKQNECCMKIKGEFKCFLNWLLTIDPSRRKRSAHMNQNSFSKKNANKINVDQNKFSDNFRIHMPSPQYRKLYEEIERVKEEGGDPWNSAP